LLLCALFAGAAAAASLATPMITCVPSVMLLLFVVIAVR
jgi:hypothetical protein